jgi:polysaccharide export outer membrane protein
MIPPVVVNESAKRRRCVLLTNFMSAFSLHLIRASTLWVLALSGCAGRPNVHTTPTPEQEEAYLRPLDRVRLKVWREPDLSGEFTVDEKGVVDFPKVGRIDVHSLSGDSLKALLVAAYSASLRDPSVEVTLLHRVNVLGAVRNPGLYYVEPIATVTDVLALAGGVSPDGEGNRVELRRIGLRQALEVSQESRSPVQSGDQLRVPERGWLARNTSIVAASITAAAIVIATLLD